MNIKKVIVIILLLSLIFTFKPLIERYNIESDYKKIEIILDYEEINELSKFSDENIVSWLEFFEDNKATKVSVQEESLDSLIKSGKELDAELVYNIDRNHKTIEALPESIVSNIKNNNIGQYDLLITMYSDDIFNFISKGLEERYDKNFYEIYNNDNVNYIVLKGSVKELILKETEKYLDYTGEPYIENHMTKKKYLMLKKQIWNYY